MLEEGSDGSANSKVFLLFEVAKPFLSLSFLPFPFILYHGRY